MQVDTPIGGEHHDAIERATLSAVAPEQVECWRGWLIPYDRGTVGRAKSAAPLGHADGTAQTLAEIAMRYSAATLTPTLRLPDRPHFGALLRTATGAGWRPTRPTQVQVSSPHEVHSLASAACQWHASTHVVHLANQATPPWQAVYLGAGFDARDGASRVQCLTRSANPHHQMPAVSSGIGAASD